MVEKFDYKFCYDCWRKDFHAIDTLMKQRPGLFENQGHFVRAAVQRQIRMYQTNKKRRY